MIYQLKIAWRTLVHGMLYTLISILGLTLGIGMCMLMATVVLDELSYDRHWSRSADVYRVLSMDTHGTQYGQQKGGAVLAGLAPELKRNFSEVEEYSELYVSPINLKIKKEDSHPIKAIALYTDSAVHQLLDIQLIEADNVTPTGDVNKVIISEKLARSYFPGNNPVGQTIYDLPQYQENANEYLVVGVMQDLPSNTHLRADLVMLKNRQEQELRTDDRGIRVRHYLLLKAGTDPILFTQKINRWYKNYVTNDKPQQFELQPIRDSYLKSDFPAYQVIRGNIQHTYIFSGVAVLLLFMACINFVNLTTARASSRLKETGVRKVLGASKGNLIRQFLMESLLTFGISAVLAVALYFGGLPLVEKFIDHPLQTTLWSAWPYYLGTFGLVLLVSLLSGLYPAWFISGVRASEGLNGLLKTQRSKPSKLREILVITQFGLSILILVSMLVVQGQVQYMKSKDTGIDTNGLVSINHVSFDSKADALKHELDKQANILSHSMSSWAPTDGAGYMVGSIDDPRNPGQKTDIWYIAGEANLAETLGLKLKEGRLLSPSLATDAIDANDFDAEINATRPCIITASTAHLLDIHTLNNGIKNNKLLPVGIVADFNSESLHKALMPTVIVGYRDPSHGALLVRTIPGTEAKVMQDIAGIWKAFYPDKLLDMAIVQETLESQYKAEEKVQQLLSGFSVLTLALAALGIFGLIVNSVSLRTKEIGIRKVLGASVSGIVTLLSMDFVKLVLIAIFVASPIAWWVMSNWLEDFAYRIEIQWWMFAVAGGVAVAIALLTVCFQAIKAAVANPVESLRDE